MNDFINKMKDFVSKLVILERKFNGCFDKTDLLPNIVPFPFKIIREYTLDLIQLLDGVCQLDLPACTRFHLVEEHEYFWCEDVSAHDRQVRRRMPDAGFSTRFSTWYRRPS
jgi:hypothetical protein